MRRILVLLMLLSSSCSTLQRMVLKGASPILLDGADKFEQERSWDFFRNSAPANLKFVEMLYLQDTKNLELLSALIKNYSVYAFVVPETLAMDDVWGGLDPSVHKQNAIEIHTRALDYGIDYLQMKDINTNSLLNLSEAKLRKLFNANLGEDDYKAILFTAHSWLRLIHLQKENAIIASQIPRTKILFDWVCKKNPDIENHLCEMFNAQYESSRNLEKGKELFREAILKRPHNLLIRLSYIESSIIPSRDKESYL